MKKSILGLLTLSAAMLLASCGGNEITVSSSTEEASSSAAASSEEAASSEAVSASSQAAASSEEAASSEPAASSQEAEVSSEEPVASSEEPVASSEEPVASSEEPIASSEEEPASSEEPVASSEEEPASSEEPVTSSEEPVASSEEPAEVTVTFKIVIENLGEREVYMAGDFNGWKTADKLAADAEAENLYTIDITGTVGDSIEYKFVLVDGEKADWDTLNKENRNYTFAEGYTECDCGTVTLPVISDVTVTVTFKLTIENLGEREVYMAGDFNGWKTAANKLAADAEAENLYTIDLEGNVGASIEYKFVLVDGGKADWDALNKGNRKYTFAEGVTEEDCGKVTLAVVGDVDCTATFSVTFAEALTADDAVYICGDFNGWAASDGYKLATEDYLTYSIELTAKENVTYNFKFVKNSTWEDNIGNRTYTFAQDGADYVATWDTAA